jgi:uncharacterized repeat protein (TIGR03803 family)
LGNLYGLTQYGGDLSRPCEDGGCGLLFKLDRFGHKTTLYLFSGPFRDGAPNPGLSIDSAGNLYGTLSSFYGGGLFRVGPAGHETSLYSFSGGSDGGYPLAGVTLDATGNIYGTTSAGGQCGLGVVFKLDQAGNETVLHSFSGAPDGASPNSLLITDAEGNLYGTTSQGGASTNCSATGCGVVFKIDPVGNQNVLYSFVGGIAGGSPIGGLIRDEAGTLYGITEDGGNQDLLSGQGCGLVYKLDKFGNQSVLHTFNGGPAYSSITAPSDGCMPMSVPIRNSQGNLTGTTPIGGSLSNFGTLYTLNSTNYSETVYSFSGTNSTGSSPSSIVKGPNGDFFGTTATGGERGQGAVFKLNTSGQESLLYSFTGGTDGGQPQGVLFDYAGNIYGTASNGGNVIACEASFPGFSPACGVIFKIDVLGNQTVLHSFTGPDGVSPNSALVSDPAGNVYGSTQQGGNEMFYGTCYLGCGVIFKLSPSGTETVLHSFQGGPDGSGPSNVILDQEGNLYGTISNSYPYSCGYVFRMDPSGNITVLHYFPCPTNGGVSPDGDSPLAGLIRDEKGNLYGTTYQGGTSGLGTIFKVDKFGNEAILYNFTGATDGAFPVTSLARDSAGNLYGQAQKCPFFCGPGLGDVFKLAPSGNMEVLYSFSGDNNNGSPIGSLFLDYLDNLYGVASGGTYNAGILYQITQ